MLTYEKITELISDAPITPALLMKHACATADRIKQFSKDDQQEALSVLHVTNPIFCVCVETALGGFLNGKRSPLHKTQGGN